jgi:23S rRNA (adenine2503-C2)-methyltransferase
MTQLSQFRQQWRALGAKPEHESHLLRRWLHARPLHDAGRRQVQDWLPKPLLAALPAMAQQLHGLAQVASTHPAADGSARCLLALADGQTVESVLLPRSEGLCVSTQVGCAVGCTFCMTGTMGLLRQLGSAEIAAQVALARTQRAVAKVVFMGMGEPAHNLEATLEAIQTLGVEGGIGHKQLVLSSVGDDRLFERLGALRPGQVRPALALSLHSTFAERRAALLPRAPRIEPQALLQAALAYARASAYPLQVQWTLLEGVNDGDDELAALVPLLRGQPAILNMIPYNEVDALPYRRPAAERCTEIFRTLNQRGVLTRMRHSAGQDVQGGCGQLRARQAPVANASSAVQWLPAAASRGAAAA